MDCDGNSMRLYPIAGVLTVTGFQKIYSVYLRNIVFRDKCTYLKLIFTLFTFRTTLYDRVCYIFQQDVH